MSAQHGSKASGPHLVLTLGPCHSLLCNVCFSSKLKLALALPQTCSYLSSCSAAFCLECCFLHPPSSTVMWVCLNISTTWEPSSALKLGQVLPFYHSWNFSTLIPCRVSLLECKLNEGRNLTLYPKNLAALCMPHNGHSKHSDPRW